MKTLNSIRPALILFFCIIFNLASAQQNDEEQLSKYIDKILSEQFKADEPGATVLVSRHGHVIYERALGMANLELSVPMQIDNVFWVASIGKQFTAVAILQLMEQGKLNLQDEITKFIPDYPTQGYKITIEHLLTHTSGIQTYSGMEDPEKKLSSDCTPTEVIDFFKNFTMRFKPGTNWEYSNSGYFLLGYIIEKVSGRSYASYIDENFFKPLSMNNSLYANDARIVKNRVGAYSVDENGFSNNRPLNASIIYSAGAIQSTVEDLLKWQLALQSYKLLKKETLDKAYSRFILADGKETDYGYGWKLGFVYESPSIWHGGSIEGFGATEIYLPKEDVFVAILTNCDCNYPKELSFWLAAIASGKPYQYNEIPLTNLMSLGYKGVYENENGHQRIITVSENKLLSQLGRGPKSILKAFEKDKFFSEDFKMTIEFSRNIKGDIDRLISKKLTGNEVWNKTNKSIPDSNGIKVSETILQTYVGEYEIPSVFIFSITRAHGKLFLQAPEQDKLEMFAETETKFFLKINDAEVEFAKDDSGNVTKAILNQGGRQADARKIN